MKHFILIILSFCSLQLFGQHQYTPKPVKIIQITGASVSAAGLVMFAGSKYTDFPNQDKIGLITFGAGMCAIITGYIIQDSNKRVKAFSRGNQIGVCIGITRHHEKTSSREYHRRKHY